MSHFYFIFLKITQVGLNMVHLDPVVQSIVSLTISLTWIDIFTKSLTPPLNFEHVVLSPGIQIIHDITSPERAMNDKRYPSNITRICICIFVHVGSEMHC